MFQISKIELFAKKPIIESRQLLDVWQGFEYPPVRRANIYLFKVAKETLEKGVKYGQSNSFLVNC